MVGSELQGGSGWRRVTGSNGFTAGANTIPRGSSQRCHAPNADRCLPDCGALARVLISARTHGQEPSTGITVGVAFATQYPDRFQEGCANPTGAGPSVRAHRRIHRRLTAELGVSGHIQMPPASHSSCGDVVPRICWVQAGISPSQKA